MKTLWNYIAMTAQYHWLYQELLIVRLKGWSLWYANYILIKDEEKTLLFHFKVDEECQFHKLLVSPFMQIWG